MAIFAKKVTHLSDNLVGLHKDHDEERNTRFDHLQEKIKNLDDRLSMWQNIGSKKFSLVKELILVFQRELEVERAKRVDAERVKTEQVAELDRSLRKALLAEQQGLRTSEARLMDQFERKLHTLQDDVSRVSTAGSDNTHNLRRYLEVDVPKLFGHLQEETTARESMERQMLAKAMEEVGELREEIAAEQRARQETEEVMLRMMEEVVVRVEHELSSERKDRKATETQMLKLLVDTCTKLNMSCKSL